MHRLYHFPLSPFCRKVRLVLAEKKIQVDLIEEAYWQERTEFLRLNPAGKVPALKMDKLILSDSNAICEYLEETVPDPALLPKDAAARAETRRMVAWFDDKFHRDVTEKLVYEKLQKRVMRSSYPDGKAIKEGIDALKFHLGYMRYVLEDHHWLAGPKMTMADLAAAAHLSCLDYVNMIDWSLSQAVSEWYAKVKSRPSFRPLLADHISGFPAPAHYANLDF